MARPRKFDENDVLEKAMKVFWAKGYEATSMTDLTAAMDLNKGSIYSAFGSKHSLFTLALTKYTDVTYKRVENIFLSEKKPQKAFKKFFDEMLIERSIVADSVESGSLMVNSIIELAPHDEDVMHILNRQVKRLETIYANTIWLGQKSGIFRNDMSANELAVEVSVFVFGIMSYRKTGCDKEKIRMVTNNYLETLTVQKLD